MAKGFVHTVYKNETWINELEEGNKLPGTYATKEQAVAAGRDKAKSGKTEHVIHKQDGKIEGRSSYGSDPSGRG